MAEPVYRLFEKVGGESIQLDPNYSRKVAMQMAAAMRRSGRNVYARRVDIALTRDGGSSLENL